MDDDVITLAHGDGGLATLRLVRDELVARFGNPVLNRLEDAAHAEWAAGTVVVSTDSFVVTPCVFPGGDIGGLAVSGTVNDLVASGARPVFITFGLILSEGFPMPALRGILDSFADATRAARVAVVAGDTKVLGGRGGHEIYVNTTGLGVPVRPGRAPGLADARPGDRILVTGTVGDHAVAVLSAREGLGFERRVRSDCASLDGLVLPILDECPELRCLRDPTRGGAMGVLFDLADACGHDVVMDEAAVPVQPEVRAAAEMLGLDPLELVNEGKMVLVVGPTAAGGVLRRLRGHPLGRASAIVGAVGGARGGRVIVRSGGRERLALRREGQPLPRLC